ncbi:unnamed protein product [Prunus armeniaca]|uniref:Uncharacterized protein n=1 Tax=Prunus armeniaca TaxID=36596 RepID=A0A6J5XI23_PRUAR|nr:unnamed protein product [Prunus armeniaca]
MGCLSLKRPITTKREIEVIERIRSRKPKEGHVHKGLLDYKNLYKSGLISETEYLQRREEEEEERQRQMAEGRAMLDAMRRRLESRSP